MGGAPYGTLTGPSRDDFPRGCRSSLTFISSGELFFAFPGRQILAWTPPQIHPASWPHCPAREGEGLVSSPTVVCSWPSFCFPHLCISFWNASVSPPFAAPYGFCQHNSTVLKVDVLKWPYILTQDVIQLIFIEQLLCVPDIPLSCIPSQEWFRSLQNLYFHLGRAKKQRMEQQLMAVWLLWQLLVSAALWTDFV